MRAILVLVAVALGGSTWISARAMAQGTNAHPGAVVQVTPASAAPGDEVVVELLNWPDRPVQVTVCGNKALRGSQDCNLPATRAVDVRDGRATFRMRVGEPPIHCPCVVRATTINSDMTREAPFAVAGVPDGPEVLPTGGAVAARSVPVSARLEDADRGWLPDLLPVVAGPLHKTLVVTIGNNSGQPVEGLRVVAAVGRDRSEAEPVGSATVEVVEPGATATVSIPVRIGVPAWGEYEVFGSVYGLDVPGRFSTETTNDAWGFQVLLPVVLLAWAVLARRRERVVDESLREGSPPVDVPDRGRSLRSSYAAARAAS